MQQQSTNWLESRHDNGTNLYQHVDVIGCDLLDHDAHELSSECNQIHLSNASMLMAEIILHSRVVAFTKQLQYTKNALEALCVVELQSGLQYIRYDEPHRNREVRKTCRIELTCPCCLCSCSGFSCCISISFALKAALSTAFITLSPNEPVVSEPMVCASVCRRKSWTWS